MSNEQSIRDEAAEWIAGLISGNGFGDDYVDDEVKQWADDLLASPVIRRIQTEAWEQGADATCAAYAVVSTRGYTTNPYRGEQS